MRMAGKDDAGRTLINVSVDTTCHTSISLQAQDKPPRRLHKHLRLTPFSAFHTCEGSQRCKCMKHSTRRKQPVKFITFHFFFHNFLHTQALSTAVPAVISHPQLKYTYANGSRQFLTQKPLLLNSYFTFPNLKTPSKFPSLSAAH